MGGGPRSDIVYDYDNIKNYLRKQKIKIGLDKNKGSNILLYSKILSYIR